HDPTHAIAEAANTCKRYGITTVYGDKYAADFVVSEFRRHGITYKHSDKDRSQLYLEMLPKINSRHVKLLDHPGLLRELRMLHRSTGSSGRDHVDHPRGAHDDIANAVAGALSLCRGSLALQIYAVTISGPSDNPTKAPVVDDEGKTYDERDRLMSKAIL